MRGRALRIVALMESAWVTGPAKNLIEFARRTATPGEDATRVELTLVTYGRGSGESTFVAAARSAGIPTFVLAERGPFDVAVIPQLKQVVTECRPDIIQSHNIKSHFLVRLTGLYRRYPWIAFNHGYTAVDLKDRLYSQLDRWSLRAASRVVAVCGSFGRRLAARGVDPARIRIQHNPASPFAVPPAGEISRAACALGVAGEPVVLCVGRLSREKGHADLLQALALLRQTEGAPSFRLVLVGDGRERERLVRLAARLDLSGSVIFAGHQTNVRPYYAMATLLVLPSHTEGSPNVVLEALSAGLPVVATDVGGVPEILDHERTGLIVPPRHPAAMAAAIRRLLKDQALRGRLGRSGQAHVHAHFTVEAYVRALVALYEEVLSVRAAAAGV